MTTSAIYCVIGSSYCYPMEFWSNCWQAIGVIGALLFGLGGLYKIHHELKRLYEQRSKELVEKEVEAKLNRTKFFLDQHRRLFDNSDLYEITCLLDADNKKLASEDLWDKKRKFLTFIEEIALLVKSKQIDNIVAFYMFGYYARCAMHGENFRAGIDPSAEHWALFYEFTTSYEEFLTNHPYGPPDNLSL